MNRCLTWPEFGNLDEWYFFGKFIGELDIDAVSVGYRYREAVLDAQRLRLREVTGRRLLV